MITQIAGQIWRKNLTAATIYHRVFLSLHRYKEVLMRIIAYFEDSEKMMGHRAKYEPDHLPRRDIRWRSLGDGS